MIDEFHSTENSRLEIKTSRQYRQPVVSNDLSESSLHLLNTRIASESVSSDRDPIFPKQLKRIKINGSTDLFRYQYPDISIINRPTLTRRTTKNHRRCGISIDRFHSLIFHYRYLKSSLLQ